MFERIINKFKWKTARREELAFWNGVLETGYFKMSFEEFYNYRKQVMVSYAERLGPYETYFLDKTIADIGCGPLGDPAFIKGLKLYGIDPLAFEYEKLYGQYMNPFGSNIISCKGEKIKLPDKSCDCIFCINCIDHSENPLKIVKEIARLLKEDGRLVLQINIYNDINNLQRDDLDKKQHPYVFELKGIEHLLSKVNLKYTYSIEEKPIRISEENSFVATGGLK